MTKQRTTYIYIRTPEHGTEIIDQYPTNTNAERKYARAMLEEYRLAYRNGPTPHATTDRRVIRHALTDWEG